MRLVAIILLFLVSCSTFEQDRKIGRKISSAPLNRCSDLIKSFLLPDVPPPEKKLFKSTIDHPGLYLWDNWGFKEDGLTHVYSLAASKAHSSRDRHFHVHWRHFVSTNDGKNWKDLGAVLTPRKGEDLFDSQSIWSGSVTKLKNGKYIAAYTGLDPKREFLQTISFAVSDDAHNFKRTYDGKSPALSHELHRDKFLEAGYYVDTLQNLGKRTGEKNNSIQALRDPFLFEDELGTLHIFWAAKSFDDKGDVVSSIGHGIIHDLQDPKSIEILPPVKPTDGELFSQLELPNVYQRPDGKYVWIIGTTNRQSEIQAEHETQMAVRAYLSDSLDGDLTPYGDDSALFYANDKSVYGANLIQDFTNGVDAQNPMTRVFTVGESSDASFSLPPSFQLELPKE